jgi:HEAT repeat protein
MSDNIVLCRIISDFRNWSGENYRIEKNISNERVKYDELEKETGSNGFVDLERYLTYLQKKQPQLNITDSDILTGRDIDELKNEWASYYRSYAAYYLAINHCKCAVPALIETLEHDDEGMRRDATRALGDLGDKSAVPALIDALKNEKCWWVKVWIVRALGQLGDDRAVAPLIDALKNDPDNDVRAEAAISLGKLMDKSALHPLYESMMTDKDKSVRAYAAISLGLFGKKTAAPFLIGVLKDHKHMDEYVCYGAVEALIYIRNSLSDNGPFYQVIEKAIREYNSEKEHEF